MVQADTELAAEVRVGGEHGLVVGAAGVCRMRPLHVVHAEDGGQSDMFEFDVFLEILQLLRPCVQVERDGALVYLALRERRIKKARQKGGVVVLCTIISTLCSSHSCHQSAELLRAARVVRLRTC